MNIMPNIIIATAILWGVTALFVVPLANYWLKRKLEEPGYAHLGGTDLGDQDQAALKGLATKYYILADLLVLSVAGLIGGLMGYWFLGISLKAEGWPGMIAFIAASFLGVGLRSSLVPGAVPQF